MPLNWRPVGPEPESTYWQRRAVVATVVVLALAVATSLLTGGQDEPDRLAEAPRPSASPSASASASASASPPASAVPSPSPAADCAPEVLKVLAETDDDSYALGGTPRLSLTITNTGTVPCTRDLGQAAVELLVYSGSDRIWSSDDCAPGGGTAVTTLAPGEAEVQRVTWNGRRSLPGCKGEKAQAQPGTYRVHGRVGQLRVEGAVFRFTD